MSLLVSGARGRGGWSWKCNLPTVLMVVVIRYYDSL